MNRKRCSDSVLDEDHMPKLHDEFKYAIGNVSNGNCNYLFSDSITQANALLGKYCGNLVQTGERGYPGFQGFIAPINWKKEYIDEINRVTYYLAERNMLESLDGFVKRFGTCFTAKSPTITLDKLSIFFITSFAACFLMFIYMFIDPQKVSDPTPPEGGGSDGEDQERNCESNMRSNGANELAV